MVGDKLDRRVGAATPSILMMSQQGSCDAIQGQETGDRRAFKGGVKDQGLVLDKLSVSCPLDIQVVQPRRQMERVLDLGDFRPYGPKKRQPEAVINTKYVTKATEEGCVE